LPSTDCSRDSQGDAGPGMKHDVERNRDSIRNGLL
jgi:hypothetical protein